MFRDILNYLKHNFPKVLSNKQLTVTKSHLHPMKDLRKPQELSLLPTGTKAFHGEATITEAGADALLKRGVKPVVNDKTDTSNTDTNNTDTDKTDTKYVYTRDLRHRVTSLYGYSDDVLAGLIARITCPVLVVKGDHGRYYEPKEIPARMLEVYRRNPEFNLAEVEGAHHVHLNEPEKVAPHIEKFVRKYEILGVFGRSKM